MAELIWRADAQQAGGHVATYNSYGARVEIIRETPKGGGGRILTAPTGCGARAAQGNREN